MSAHHFLLIIHLICASIWVGGHLFLAIRVLPKALKKKDVFELKRFKNRYESIGMSALIILVITGVWMAYNYQVKISAWFSFSNPIEKVVSVKLILLIITFVLAQIADRFIFPKLDKKNMHTAAIFIIIVTIIGVAMLILGSFVRFGGL